MADVVLVRDADKTPRGYELQILPGGAKVGYRVSTQHNGIESSDVWPTDPVLAYERFLRQREIHPDADIKIFQETYTITRADKPISPEELQRLAGHK